VHGRTSNAKNAKPLRLSVFERNAANALGAYS
jgi:hypothetical protein